MIILSQRNKKKPEVNIMAKITDTLDMKIKYVLNFVRVPAFKSAVITRVKSINLCRYSCVSGNMR